MSTVIPATAGSLTPSVGWIRSRSFDFHFIVTAGVVALASGMVALANPHLVNLVLLIDLWLLGFHHVVSTFTRLVFDKQSFRENRFLVVHLPVIVAAGTAAIAWCLGLWSLVTIYLYWQWFHYTRQSFGVERNYRRKADPHSLVNDSLSKWALYLVPLAGIIYRSWQQPDSYLGLPVWTLPIPNVVMVVAAAAAAGAFLLWFASEMRALASGRLAVPHFLYMLSHFTIFGVGYLLIDDVTTGWIVLNVWHNIQYIMFVWWFNNNRFKDTIDPERPFLSRLCQSNQVVVYLGVCFILSSVIYAGMQIGGSLADPIPVTIVSMMAINFHHYVVDGMIWKRKRAAAGSTPPAPAAA